MRIYRVAALALGALLLTGCSGHAAISDEKYLEAIDGLESFSHLSDEQLLDFGQKYCDYLSEHGGETDSERKDAAMIFLNTDADQGGDLLETTVVLGSAVQRFCPQYRTD